MFHKKYKIKKRKKAINPYLIFSILAIGLIFVSYSYALLSDTLTIRGLVNILSSDPSDIEYGNSTYTYENRASWSDTAGNPIYDVYVCITNLDQDFTGDPITICFDTNSGFAPELHSNNCNIWQASSITCSGSRVTLVLSANNSWVNMGSTIDLYFQLPFTQQHSAINITNVTLNGKYVRYIGNNSEDTPSTNTTTNSTTENTVVANNTTENTTITNNTTENTVIANNSIENTTIANNSTENTTVANNTVTENTTPTPDVPKPDTGNTSYNYTIVEQWGNTYAIEIPITYSGEDLNSWSISLTIPDGLIVEQSMFYQCSSISLSGNTLTLTPYDWSSTLTSGSTLTLSGQLKFESEVDFFINNVSINGAVIPYTP